MIFIETNSCTPAVNLAYEEYFLKSRDLGAAVCMLWRNTPTVVVGRFQNTLVEVDLLLAAERQIPVVRRISGGGAVYHDLGNLCFSFIFGGIDPKTFDKTVFGRALSGALEAMGLAVTVTRRNDLLLNGMKFSGNAMAMHKDRLLYHGTLLFDSELETLTAVLTRPAARVEAKGIRSVSSPVTNLRPHLPGAMDILDFKAELARRLAGEEPVVTYTPTQADQDAVAALAGEKYGAWDWNFGMDPLARIRQTCCLGSSQGADSQARTLEIELEVEHGLIRTCRVQDPAAGPGGRKIWDAIEARLQQVRSSPEDLRTALTGLGLETVFGYGAPERLAATLLGQV